MFEERTDRGQVGIGTLIVFIAMVLVAAIAAGVLINTAGFLQTQSEQTGQQSSAQVTDRLEPVSKTGNVSAYDSFNQTIVSSTTPYSDGNNTNVSLRVNEVSLVVQKAPGASDINMSATTFELVGPEGTDRFAFTNESVVNRTGAAGPNDRTRALQDDDTSLNASDGNSGLILNSRTDRLVVTLNMTEMATNGAFVNEPLEPGDTVTLRVNTESGATSIIRIRVPQSLAGEESVAL
ncbi:archaellin/type IV pilin N-terminal domain-containing protein [Haloplanus natans]|uniref:archaellin/type IV pilin N-terminal domain-containing protein n=1 Tax=Haloplanus natans TaxID=376171 RepID=UPI00067800CF|nr:archaellin/type IV pilin N-terminal domain-containing protein [Haloplanus natans]